MTTWGYDQHNPLYAAVCSDSVCSISVHSVPCTVLTVLSVRVTAPDSAAAAARTQGKKRGMLKAEIQERSLLAGAPQWTTIGPPSSKKKKSPAPGAVEGGERNTSGEMKMVKSAVIVAA